MYYIWSYISLEIILSWILIKYAITILFKDERIILQKNKVLRILSLIFILLMSPTLVEIIETFPKDEYLIFILFLFLPISLVIFFPIWLLYKSRKSFRKYMIVGVNKKEILTVLDNFKRIYQLDFEVVTSKENPTKWDEYCVRINGIHILNIDQHSQRVLIDILKNDERLNNIFVRLFGILSFVLGVILCREWASDIIKQF